MTKPLKIIDLFCGAGGTSSGILKACVGKPVELVAVNHWKTAINTHSLNHPKVRHICEPVENLHPLDLVKGGHLHLLAASCECRYHSNARGGGVCNDQSRSQAWQLIRFLTDLRVDNLMMENVREFENWGPLNRRTKKPLASKRGMFFKSFIQTLINLGYAVEHRIQCAGDFGDATSRKRLILMARKNHPVIWPAPTHGPGRDKPYRTAREIIDWSLKGRNILDRAIPYCKNTIKRMAEGLQEFGGANAKPYLVMLNGTTKAHIKSCSKSVDDLLPTVTCTNRIMLIQPFLIQTDQTGGNGRCLFPLNKPVPTIVTKQNLLLVEPFLLKYYKTGTCKSVDLPLDTITTKARFMLVEPVGGKEVAEIGLRTRMLQPHELGAAHSFDPSYVFTGSKANQTKQIGNSVPVELAAAHARMLL